MSLFVVGDETGLIKLIDLASKEIRTYGQQSRTEGIVGISNFNLHNNLCSIVRKSGTCEIWGSNVQNEETFSMHSTIESNIEDPVGCVSLLNSCGDVSGSLVYGKNGSICSVEQSISGVSMTSSMKLDGPLESCETLHGGQFLFGGKENDVKLVDLKSQNTLWTAKNVPRDNLNLRIPVWITSISAVDNNTFYTGTGYKHLRFYDIRCSSQPIKSIEISQDFRISSMKYNKTLEVLYIADTAGNADIYDPSSLRRKYTLKGATGSVRSIALANHDQQVATVGLDRHLRVYNGSNSKLIDEFYLKNRLNACVSIVGNDDTAATLNEDEDGQDSDGDSSKSSAHDDSSNDFLQEMQESDFE